MTATQDWMKEVISWYAAYSKEEKLLVLNTRKRMIDFIENLLSHQRSQVLEEAMEMAEGMKKTYQKDEVETIIPSESSHLGYYNKAVTDLLAKLKSMKGEGI